jgi:hypothetical protein
VIIRHAWSTAHLVESAVTSCIVVSTGHPTDGGDSGAAGMADSGRYLTQYTIHPRTESGTEVSDETDARISKFELAWGAAKLFLFLVGVKRSYRRDDGIEIQSDGRRLRGVGGGSTTSRSIIEGR